MFYFYHSQQNADNASYYKGVLFETLLKRYLQELGFRVELRQKRNSLEYDLEGTAQLDGRRLYGEAKAHGRPIAGEVFSSFVGKLFPLHARDSHITGIFLSTSALTSDAEDYLRSLDSTGLKLRAFTGDKLLLDICKTLQLPLPSLIEEIAKNLSLFPLSMHLLVTDSGPFLLEVCAGSGGATPSAFFLVREDGTLITDRMFLDGITQQLPDLKELVAAGQARHQPAEDRKEIPEGLIVGNEWADYRLPAPPEFFVGRAAITERMLSVLLGSSPGVVQLKSRSGVGKSSLMAFLAGRLQNSGVFTQIYDARNVKSVLDVWSVVQRFTAAGAPPTESSDVETQLRALVSRSAVRSVLIIDQFEYTFTYPELFEAYEFIALAAVKLRPSVSVVFARKNDLLTTYDDSRITLERLNEISESILLEDFGPAEAVELIEQISKHSGKPVSAEVKAYVLEFAQGFPWLLKRTMAHILRLRNKGGAQVELLPAALRLDDLFNEELEGLDELERDYLIRVTQRLPATYQDLDRYFDGDPYLPPILEKLTRDRLIRLSGSTYDTYNDVFKEYLVYKRLPDFRLSYVYRLGPAMVLGTFRRVAEIGRFTNEKLGQELHKARGTTFNLLRELRNHGLVDRDGTSWVVPDAVLDAMGRERLGEYMRQQLVRNGLVADLLTHVHSNGFLLIGEVPSFLRERFPFVTASNATWANYSKILLKWLKTVRLIVADGDRITSSKDDRAVIAREIGNLRQKFRSRGESRHFLPGAYWSHVESAFSLLQSSGVATLSTKQRDAFRNLVDLQLCTEDGRCIAKSFSEVKSAVASTLDGEPYRSFWDAARRGDSLSAILISKCGLGGLEPSTIQWRQRLLINWGRAVGKLSTSRKRRRVEPTLPLLE